jgi:hypothetical protein
MTALEFGESLNKSMRLGLDFSVCSWVRDGGANPGLKLLLLSPAVAQSTEHWAFAVVAHEMGHIIDNVPMPEYQAHTLRCELGASQHAIRLLARHAPWALRVGTRFLAACLLSYLYQHNQGAFERARDWANLIQQGEYA